MLRVHAMPVSDYEVSRFLYGGGIVAQSGKRSLCEHDQLVSAVLGERPEFSGGRSVYRETDHVCLQNNRRERPWTRTGHEFEFILTGPIQEKATRRRVEA